MSDVLKHSGQARRRYRLTGDGAPPAGEGTAARFGSGDDHVDDLVAAYALGALDPEERGLVEHHVRACSRCARLVADERRVVGLLPLAVPPAVPSPDVKLTLFARVAQSQAENRVGRATASIPATGRDRALLPPTLTIPASRPATAAPAAVAAARRSRSGLVGSALTLPLLVALVATGAWGWQLRGEVAERAAQVSALKASFATFGASSATESVALEGESARGELLVGADQALLRLQIDDPRAGKAYQLKGFNQEGQLVPVGELEVNAQGEGFGVFPFEQSLDDYSRLEVKAKPIDGEREADDPVMSGRPNGSIGSDDPTANSALPGN